MVNLISRKPTLIIVSMLCILQFVWTIVQERVSGVALLGSVAAVVVVNAGFHLLYHLGRGENALGESVHTSGHDVAHEEA